MAESDISDQLKVKAVKSLPQLAKNLISLSYRGTVITIQFIKQLLVDALSK